MYAAEDADQHCKGGYVVAGCMPFATCTALLNTVESKAFRFFNSPPLTD